MKDKTISQRRLFSESEPIVVIAVRMKHSLKERLKKVAQDNDRNMSQQISRYIKDGLKNDT